MVGLEDTSGLAATCMQLGFVQHFILPLWESVARVLPELQHFADNATSNVQNLRRRKEDHEAAAAAAATAAAAAGLPSEADAGQAETENPEAGQKPFACEAMSAKV